MKTQYPETITNWKDLNHRDLTKADFLKLLKLTYNLGLHTGHFNGVEEIMGLPE